MRQFLVVGHDAPTTPEFSLDDLAGAAGRLDVLCRCVGASFFLSHGLRESVRTHLVLGDEYTVTFDGTTLRRLNPDERSTAALIRGALEARREAVGAMEATASPGVSIRKGDLDSLLEESGDATVIELHAEGRPVVDLDPPETPVFVLSDHREFTERERSLLSASADERVSLGPRALHADGAITVAHNYLDTDGFSAY
jgi:tRNA (pseudouridine54-N1)-methyltransferase